MIMSKWICSLFDLITVWEKQWCYSHFSCAVVHKLALLLCPCLEVMSYLCWFHTAVPRLIMWIIMTAVNPGSSCTHNPPVIAVRCDGDSERTANDCHNITLNFTWQLHRDVCAYRVLYQTGHVPIGVLTIILFHILVTKSHWWLIKQNYVYLSICIWQYCTVCTV